MAVAAVVTVAAVGALAIVVDNDDVVAPVNSSATDDAISVGTAPTEGSAPAEDVPPAAGSDQDRAGTTDAGATATTPVPGAVPPSAPPPAPVEPTCTYLGLDDFDDMQVELSFVNFLGPLTSLRVDYALSDADGVRFHTGAAAIDLPRTEEHFRVPHDTVEPLPAAFAESTITCQVIEITEGFGSPDVRPPGVGDGCAVVGIDGFGDVQIELTAASPFDQRSEILLTYALTSPGGIRFATAVSIVAAVEGGETVRQAVDTVVAPPPWAEEVVCELLGIESLDL